MKKRVSILAMAILITLISLTASAHEYSPEMYFGNLSKPIGYQAQVNFKYHAITTTTNAAYCTKVSQAVNAWASACPRIVPTQFTSQGSADIVFYDSWPSTLPTFAVGAAKFTPIDATLWNWGTNWSAPTSSKTVKRLNSAGIYVNIPLQNLAGYTDANIMHTYLHEIGHTLGFDETIDGTVSVMQQGQYSYMSPQSHDISDFNSKYGWVSW